MNPPLVTIILPAYNSGHRIEKTIRSIQNQSFTSWELIVIDDGSRDDTFEVGLKHCAADQRIKCFKNEVNLGLQKTLNKALALSTTGYIARIDDDDEWFDSEKLKKQFEYLSANPDYVLVGTGAVVVSELGKELFRYFLPKEDTQIRRKILGRNCFIHSSVLFKKSSALELGGYDESENARYTQDYDLWLKLGMVGKFANLQEYGVLYTERKTGMSDANRIRQSLEALQKVIKFKDTYPNFIGGLVQATLRLCFFYFQKYIPSNKSLIHKIKKVYKQY